MKIKKKLSFSPSPAICFIAAILLVCNSCMKQQADQLKSDYHITFNLNGNAQYFSQNDTCQITSDSSGNVAMQELSIRGHRSAEVMEHAPVIELALLSSNSITPGTYTDSSSNDHYSVYADYIPIPDINLSPSNIFLAGDGVYTDGIQKGVQLSHHLTITITSISGGIIKGTFSGDFYEYDGDITQAQIDHITDGDFYLKVQ